MTASKPETDTSKVDVPQDQSEAIAFLASADNHPGNGPVEVVQTHGALVFLSGNVALKIKRSVRYDYMDLSTLDRREALLRHELDLNRPTAPKIYQDVVPLTREPDGELALDGNGSPVEWVLRMWRFPADDELEIIAERGGFDDVLANELGQSIHAYHLAAPRRDLGGAKLIADIKDELDRNFADMHGPLDPRQISKFSTLVAERLATTTPLLDQRGINGKVRRCHGDLHLRNLVLIDGKPIPFDALEFDEVLGTCDVLYDLAFLIMDLRHRHLLHASNIVLNTYLLAAQGDEDSGLAALPLFLSIRAAIRAMVVMQTDRASAGDGRTFPEARTFLDEAIGFLDSPGARLVAVGGLSGSGKTTIACEIAADIGATPGAVHLRTDLERKAMAGVAAQNHLPIGSYAQEERDKVYERIFARSETILRAGHSVLIDATFLAPATREKAEALAARLAVPFTGLWLQAPPDTLLKRVATRALDASDADTAVVEGQLRQPLGSIGWQQVNTGDTIPDTVKRAKAALHARV